jgi:peptide-methionine (S)-S-oxide reductase
MLLKAWMLQIKSRKFKMVSTDKATFGMGCFWGPQLLFSKVKGVMKTEVGYMGEGDVEVVQMEFDFKKISYKELLKKFWGNINPISKNRQGLNIGRQYRTVIYYHNEKQKKEAEESKRIEQIKLNEKKSLFGSNKIVTEIVKSSRFSKAEEYHQNYLKKRGTNTC